MPNDDEILESLNEILRNFQGREYSGSLNRDTRFFADLGFASIDAVVLGEKLDEQFDRQFPFNTLLSELAEQGAEDLTLGEMVTFLSDQMQAR
jgi:acyl carrier protein